MPIKAQITKEAVNSAEKIKAHFIPASIDGNGTMKIDEYFNSYLVSEESGRKIFNIDLIIASTPMDFSANQLSAWLSIKRN